MKCSSLATPRSALRCLGILIGLLLLLNVSFRLYSYATVDCPVEKNAHFPLPSSSSSSSPSSSSLCCPKVFFYDPREIQKKAQKLHENPLLLQHLDPLNIPATFDNLPYGGNTSIPMERREEVLTQLLRWMPQEDEVNQSLITPSRDQSAKIWYSKDFVNAFNFRVAISSCVTADPTEAELFLIPMSVHTDHAHGKKTVESGEWDALFASLTNYQLLLEHFSVETASKHVIFSSSFGHSRKSIGLWHPPFADPRVATMQRVALGSECLIKQSYQALHYFMRTPVHVHSVPFNSLLPYPENYFYRGQEKNLLVSAFFGFHGRDKVRKLRTKLIGICEDSKDCSTKAMKSKSSKSDRKEGILAIFETKRNSIFCMEPEGDWPTRQSMIQDIMLTCIPVFFTQNHLRLWPAFWGNFIESASVTFDYDDVMSGKVDVIESLSMISPQTIEKKQKVMEKYRHQLYFLHMDDYMESGNNHKHTCSIDAANLLLHDLKAASLSKY